MDDQNPGVRVEAVNSLREMAEKGEVTSDSRSSAGGAARSDASSDPNTYIPSAESAAAIRDLGFGRKISFMRGSPLRDRSRMFPRILSAIPSAPARSGYANGESYSSMPLSCQFSFISRRPLPTAKRCARRLRVRNRDLSADLVGIGRHARRRKSIASQVSCDFGNIFIHTMNSGKVDYRVHLEADASEEKTNARLLLKKLPSLCAKRPGRNPHQKRDSEPGDRAAVGKTRRELTERLQPQCSHRWRKYRDRRLERRCKSFDCRRQCHRRKYRRLGAPRNQWRTHYGEECIRRPDGEHGRRPYHHWRHRRWRHVAHKRGAYPCILRQRDPPIWRPAAAPSPSSIPGGELVGGDFWGPDRGWRSRWPGSRQATDERRHSRRPRFGASSSQTGGGNIYLTQVNSAVKASTGAGGITAWFVAAPKQPGNCELQSSAGDVVVYLPRQLPVTIDAQIQMDDDHRVIVDPAFPLRVTYDNSQSSFPRA